VPSGGTSVNSGDVMIRVRPGPTSGMLPRMMYEGLLARCCVPFKYLDDNGFITTAAAGRIHALTLHKAVTM
jgi:hypothetical protein